MPRPVAGAPAPRLRHWLIALAMLMGLRIAAPILRLFY